MDCSAIGLVERGEFSTRTSLPLEVPQETSDISATLPSLLLHQHRAPLHPTETLPTIAPSLPPASTFPAADSSGDTQTSSPNILTGGVPPTSPTELQQKKRAADTVAKKANPSAESLGSKLPVNPVDASV